MITADVYPEDVTLIEFFGGKLDGTLQIVPRYMLKTGYRYTNVGPWSHREVYVFNLQKNAFYLDSDIY